MTAEDLKTLRTRLGLTQRQLAKAIGNDTDGGARRMRRYEKGDKRIPPEVAERIMALEPQRAG